MESLLEDDDLLLAHLDTLGDEEESAPLRAADAQIQTADQLIGLITAANSALQDCGDSIPVLHEDASNIGQVLAAALIAVSRLSDSTHANVALRLEADKRASRLAFDLADAERSKTEAKREAKEKLKKEQILLSNAREDFAREQRMLKAELSSTAELRATASSATNRANVAEAATRRCESELNRLQKRMHQVLGSSRKPNFNFAVTLGSGESALSKTRKVSSAKKKENSIAKLVKMGTESERIRASKMARRFIEGVSGSDGIRTHSKSAHRWRRQPRREIRQESNETTIRNESRRTGQNDG